MQLLFLLFFLVYHVAMVTAVPGCRDGRDRDHRPSIDCNGAGLNNIPADISPETQVLLFPNNLFSTLSWSSFQIFKNIHTIDLSGNKVPAVTSADSPLLLTLSVLRLGSNRLTSLSDDSFYACPGLTELYLNNNTIQSLSNRTFSGLDKLQILDLSSNHITVLPGLMLHPLPALETLHIENNKIRMLPVDWFSKKEDVPYLFFSANPWDCTCTNLYLQKYMYDFDSNFYVRDGNIISYGADKVVCSSPSQHQGVPVMNLEESDFCPSDVERRGEEIINASAAFTEAAHSPTFATTQPTPTRKTSSSPSTTPPEKTESHDNPRCSNQPSPEAICELSRKLDMILELLRKQDNTLEKLKAQLA